MPGNDLNVNLPVGITNNTAGTIGKINRDLDDTRKRFEKPMRSSLELDASVIERTSRAADNLRSNLSRPFRLPPMQGGENGPRWQRTRRRGDLPAMPSGGGYDDQVDALRNRGIINRTTPWPEIPLKTDPIGLRSEKPDRTDEQQQVRNAMAGIVRGMDRRAKAEQAIAKQAEIELAARKELGLRVARTDISQLRNPDRFAARQDEQRRLARGGDGLSAAESNYFDRTRNSLSRNAQAARLGNRGFGGGPGNGNGPASAIGADGSVLRTEDKIGLGSGAKLLGPAAAVLGGASLGIAAFGEIGNQLKAYSDRLAQGASGRDAFILGLKDFGAKLPIIGGVLDGLENLAAELNGDADKIRARAKSDQKANDNASITQTVMARRARGDQINEDLRQTALAADAGLRLGRAGIGDDTGRKAAQEQAQIDYENATRDIEKNREKFRAQANSSVITNEAFTSISARLDQQKKDAAEKLEQDLSKIRIDAAKEEVAQRKQTEGEVFNTRQAYLNKEGEAVKANLEAVDRQAEEDKRVAREQAEKVTNSFGAGSSQDKLAQSNLAAQLKAIDDRKNVNRSAIIEQAGRDNRNTEIGELRYRAALGDVTAALKASELSIDAQNEARRKQLAAIVNNTALTQQQRDAAQAGLNVLKQQAAQQKQMAADQIRAAEAQRKLSVYGDANSDRIAAYRRQADLTGDGSLSLKADAYDLIQQNRQRQAALQERLAGTSDPKERADLQQALADLPGELQRSVDGLTKAKVSGQDFVNATLSQAVDATSYSGLALDAKENAQIKTASLTEEVRDLLKTLVNAVTNGQAPKLIPLPKY